MCWGVHEEAGPRVMVFTHGRLPAAVVPVSHLHQSFQRSKQLEVLHTVGGVDTTNCCQR